MNVVLYIKKKWLKLVGLMVVEVDDDKAEDVEEEEEAVEARLNVLARNIAMIPKKVPDNVPYTR
jgi:chaperonin cofactor prefoldin